VTRDLGLPKGDRPEEVGLLPERLQRISAAFRDEVGRGLIPGAVLRIAAAAKSAMPRPSGGATGKSRRQC
jgi:hypothetical protein